MANSEEAFEVRRAHIEHLRGGFSDVAQRNSLEPATGNQLWRINALGLMRVALDAEAEVASDGAGTYVSRGIASSILELAKSEGLF